MWPTNLTNRIRSLEFGDLAGVKDCNVTVSAGTGAAGSANA